MKTKQNKKQTNKKRHKKGQRTQYTNGKLRVKFIKKSEETCNIPVLDTELKKITKREITKNPK